MIECRVRPGCFEQHQAIEKENRVGGGKPICESAHLFVAPTASLAGTALRATLSDSDLVRACAHAWLSRGCAKSAGYPAVRFALQARAETAVRNAAAAAAAGMSRKRWQGRLEAGCKR